MSLGTGLTWTVVSAVRPAYVALMVVFPEPAV